MASTSEGATQVTPLKNPEEQVMQNKLLEYEEMYPGLLFELRKGSTTIKVKSSLNDGTNFVDVAGPEGRRRLLVHSVGQQPPPQAPFKLKRK